MKFKLFDIRILIFAIVIASALNMSAQDLEPSRFEIERQSTEQSIHAQPIDEQGVILFYPLDNTKTSQNTTWEFINLDTNLIERSLQSFSINAKLQFQSCIKNSLYAVFLFSNNEKKTDSIVGQLIIYNRTNNSYQSETITQVGKSNISSINLLNNTILMIENTDKNNNRLISLNINNLERKTLTIDIQDEDYSFFKIESFERENLFVAAAKVFEKKHFSKTLILRIDSDGTLLKTNEINNYENYSLGRMNFAFNTNQQLIVVTTLEQEVGKKLEKKEINEKVERVSQGFCFAKFDNDTLQLIKKYSFNDLHQANSRKTLFKKNSQQILSFQLLPPELVVFDSNYIVKAEAYVPVYRAVTHMGYDFYGRSMPYTEYVFDGYNFFSTLITSFDEDGNVKWRSNLDFEEENSFDLCENVSSMIIDNNLIFCSLQNNNILYQIYDTKGNIVLKNEFSKIDMFFAGDNLTNENKSKIIFWYNNCCLTYGNQIIENGRLNAKNKRTIYFLQKVKFE